MSAPPPTRPTPDQSAPARSRAARSAAAPTAPNPTAPDRSSTRSRAADPPVGGADDVALRGPRSIRVVANRLPISWAPAAGWQRAPGGLVTAVGAVLRTGVDWTGSSASLGDAPGDVPRWEHGTLGVVPIEPSLAGAAVDGMANQALWPALHGDAARMSWDPYWWQAYRVFNERFARSVIARAAPGDRIWIHDYHLFLLPALLRARRPDLRVGMSIHTPVDAEHLLAIPQSGCLADGLAGSAVIGVQRRRDVEQLESVFAARSGTPSRPRIVVSPVSIDPTLLRERLRQPAVRALAERERARASRRRLVVGVDRLDHTKGLEQRLEAYRLVLDRGPLTADDLHIVQVAQPTRPSIPEYRAVRRRVEALAADLNARFPRADGSPVLDLRIGAADQREVVALLSVADVAMVTPRRDGMNLVAKEFSVVNAGHGGALVLGVGAGAIDELGSASIVVDGSSATSVAGGLDAALATPLDRRVELARQRAAAVDAWTSADWCAAFVDALEHTQVGP